MRVTPIYGTAPDDAGKRWFFDFYEQWSGFFPPRNWVDFTLIDLNGEWSPYKGSAEVSVALLGLRVTVTYVYDSVADRKSAQDAAAILERAKGEPSQTGEV